MPKGLSAERALIHPGADTRNSTFGPWTEIGADSVILNSQVGAYSYCGRLCDIANTSVGRFSNIASMVRIGATDHPLTTASLHHFLYRSSSYWPDEDDDAAFFAARAARLSVIGHDTWIGHGALIKPEVTVGHGAVIGAGSVVTKDVAPWTIVAGNPARLIRRRFSEDLGAAMERLAWWDWDHDRLGAALPDFRALPAAEFVAKYG